MSRVVKKVFHMFGATGGGAKGFKRACVRLGLDVGTWECIGSVDIDARANGVFRKRVGIPATTLDLADRSQYIAINGKEPPPGWVEATPGDIQRAANGMRPDCAFLSAPCKGFSGLLPEALSITDKYQAMNGLAERGLFLLLEAFRDDPIPVILFENVPRLITRGRAFVDRLLLMMRAFGYVARETVHDCGEIGGLGQSRKRCLIIARHAEKVPAFLYEPPKRPLRSVGDVIGKLWIPGDDLGGPLHRVPNLQWKTWVRLAFVEAGSDWRSLNKLEVEDGVLRDYLLVPEMHRGGYGVHDWGDSSGVVAAQSRPSNGAFSVADPRFHQSAEWNDGHAYGVRRWVDSSGTVTSKAAPGGGYFTVADPRHDGPPKHSNEFKIVRWGREAGAVTGAHGSGQCVADPRPGWSRFGNNLSVGKFEDPARAVIAGGKGVQGGWLSVADPRPNREGRLFTKYPVAQWEGSSGTVIAGDDAGAYAVADPRPGMQRGKGDAYLTGGHYGVVPWGTYSGALSASACHDNGPWSVADPRGSGSVSSNGSSLPESFAMPLPADKMVARIRSLDGAWHRPFTTLELSALQSLFDPEDPADIAAFTDAYTSESRSDSMHREWTGNAVPPAAAAAIAEEILRTLMLADAGETFQLSATPVWVRPVIAGLSLAQGDAS